LRITEPDLRLDLSMDGLGKLLRARGLHTGGNGHRVPILWRLRCPGAQPDLLPLLRMAGLERLGHL